MTLIPEQLDNLVSKDDLIKATEVLVTKEEFKKVTDNLVTKEEFRTVTDNLVTKEKFNVLNSKVDHLSDKVENLSDRVENLSDRVDHLSDRVENIDSRLCKVEKNTDILIIKMIEHEQRFDIIEVKLDAVIEGVSDILTAIDGLVGKTKDHETELVSNITAHDRFESRITAIETQLQPK